MVFTTSKGESHITGEMDKWVKHFPHKCEDQPLMVNSLVDMVAHFYCQCLEDGEKESLKQAGYLD